MRIAIYGKGGIGKSTLSANLSAAFAAEGRRVLQIGCDPKQDSTRLLLGGRRVQTVLDYLRRTPPGEQRLSDIIHSGFSEVGCVEAGGPEPGVGCAGRGILSAFALLERLGCRWDTYDVTLYDVLGDVVCGGFAVPLRKGFADVVLVVTSEEFMSLYAANNIMRGVENMEQDEPRTVGLLLNCREPEGRQEVVHRFADATGIPLLATVPRSGIFREAEILGQTLTEAFPHSGEAGLFRRLAQSLTSYPAGTAIPLGDTELERLVLGRQPKAGPVEREAIDIGTVSGDPPSDDRAARIPPETGRYLSKSLLSREPLHGCAFTGAVNTLTQIGDAVVLAHGPRSCTHIAASTMLSSGLASLQRYGTRIPEQLSPALVGTEMTDDALIHGGMDNFRDRLQQVLQQGPAGVFVVATCPAGVIGDDVGQAIRDVGGENAGPVIPVATDGNIEGDYLQGVINACLEGASELIDPGVRPREDWVNIVAEKNIALNADANYLEIARLLDLLGLKVNCRFVRRTTVAALRNFMGAALNLPAYVDHLGRVLRDFLTEKFGCPFARNPFPSGFRETERWVREIAAHTHRTDRADGVLDRLRNQYLEAIERLRPHLAGKRLMLVTYNHDVDWILETAFDLDMRVVKVGIVDYSQDGLYRTRYADRVTAETGYNPEGRAADIEALRPDLCLGNYQSPGLPDIAHYDTIPLCPNAGPMGGLALARRWQRLLFAPLKEGWRRDEKRLLRDTAGQRN